MNAEKFLESKSYEAIRGMGKVDAVYLADALIALEIARLEAMIDILESYDIMERSASVYEKQLQALKTKHSIS